MRHPVLDRSSCLSPRSVSIGPHGSIPILPRNVPSGFTLWMVCREECIFTIDPATARDLDDALSCKQLPDGEPLCCFRLAATLPYFAVTWMLLGCNLDMTWIRFGCYSDVT